MAEARAMEVQNRTQVGTGAARAIRRQGQIPAILYGEKKDPVALAVSEKLITRELLDPHVHTKIYEIEVNGKKEKVLIRDVQLHPVTDRPEHVDFQRIDPAKKLHVDVHIRFINEDKSPGIKRGGVLNVVVHELPVSCYPHSIPSEITIDLSGRDVGTSIHLKDLALPEGVQPLHTQGDQTIATLVAPSGMKSDTSTEA